MKTIVEKSGKKTQLTNEQIIQKKLNDIKPFIENLDLSKLPKRSLNS